MKNRKQKTPNKDWLDWWLSDDAISPPEDYEEQMRNVSNLKLQPEPEVIPDEPKLPEPADPNLTINIQMPTLGKARLSSLKAALFSKELVKVAVFAAVMMLFGFVTHTLVNKSQARQLSSNGQSVLAANTQNSYTSAPNPFGNNTQNITLNAGQDSNKAQFTPVAPATKPQLANYDPASTTYSASTGIYTYIDNITGTNLKVSEQPVPTIYKNTSDALTHIAQSLNANKSIQTSAGQAYIFTSPTGQQTVVFALKGLYIYINSDSSFSDKVWQAYINTLT